MKMMRRRAISFATAFGVVVSCVFSRPLAKSVSADAKAPAKAAAAALDFAAVAQKYNLICLEDYNNLNSDIEGPSAIGGKIEVSAFKFGTNVNPSSTSPYGLVWGAQDEKEFAFSNGSSAAKALVNEDLKGKFTDNSYQFFGGIDTWTDLSDLETRACFTFDSLKAELMKTSDQIAGLKYNGAITLGGDGKLVFRGTDQNCNIFSIDADTLKKYATVKLDVPDNSTTLINVISVIVSGSTTAVLPVVLPTVQNKDAGDLMPTQREHLLWNLNGASAVSNHGTNSIEGSVLAPLAKFTPQGSSHYNGTMMVASFGYPVNGSAEGHFYPFEGKIPDQQPDLTVDKTAHVSDKVSDFSGWNNRVYKLNLTITANTKIVTEHMPCDVVLVLDRSGSMLEDYYAPVQGSPDPQKTYYIYIQGACSRYQQLSHDNAGWYYYDSFRHDVTPQIEGTGQSSQYQFYAKASGNKMDALKSAAKSFVSSIKNDSSGSSIALVSFSDDVKSETGGLLPLTDANVIRIDNDIQGLTPKQDGATHSYLGMYEARQILSGDTQTGRSRIVVMFTDGQPGEHGFDDDFGYESAASTINEAAILKAGRDSKQLRENIPFNHHNGVPQSTSYAGTPATGDGCGASVYTVGLFSGKDMNHLGTINSYMGAVATDANHYLPVSDTSSLSDIFQKLSKEIGTVSGATVTDVIDSHFQLTTDTRESLENEKDVSITDDPGGTTTVVWKNQPIDVPTGNETTSWEKELYIRAKDDFMGGNAVPTNAPGSGVSYGDHQFMTFPQPTVNVKAELEAGDSNAIIFRGESVPTEQANQCKKWTASGVTFQWYQSDHQTPLAGENTGFPDGLKPDASTSYWLHASYACGSPTKESKDNTDNWTAGDSSKNYILTTNTENGKYTVQVVTGEIDLTKFMTAQYPVYDPNDGTPVNPQQSFVFKITRSETPQKAQNKEYDEIFYEVITPTPGASGTPFSGSKMITGLRKGVYTVTEETGGATQAWRYSQTDLVDNDAVTTPAYTSTANDGIVFIGRDISGSGAKAYFGAATGNGIVANNPATVTFTNTLSNFHWAGDVTVAVNTVRP